MDLAHDADDRSPNEYTPTSSFAPPNGLPQSTARRRIVLPDTTAAGAKASGSFARIHNAWSTAVNSRLGRADNARFLEHFRYVIVASQLLNEYLDQGSLPPPSTSNLGLDGSHDEESFSNISANLYGAAATAAVAFALVYLIHWARGSRSGLVSRGRVTLVLAVLAVATLVGYAYIRRQWLKSLRRQAVADATNLTANWQAFEISASSALSLIQEVELVSKGYRLSTPLPPASRIEDQGGSRRCVRLRKALHRSYSSVIPAVVDGCSALRSMIDDDDLEKYFEIYDINAVDAREASGPDALKVLEDDPESLKSLRVLSYRAGVLRRVALCSLMSLEADGGKPDFARWRLANSAMESMTATLHTSSTTLQSCLADMETIATPLTPATRSPTSASFAFPPVAKREKMRSQVRKISALSSGIRGLQAKMQVLREETNRAIERSEDSSISDLGPDLMAQYEAIGADLRELMQAWETGKSSLQNNLNRHERRISLASSNGGGGAHMRSPVSSLGGLTAVSENSLGGPADALKALNGDSSTSNRSSMANTSPSPSDSEEVFEGISVPRQRERSTLTREERIVKMQEERERQATLRQKRESNTNMLRELESVINLRPKKSGAGGGNNSARITSI